MLRINKICNPIQGIEIDLGTDYADFTFKSTGTEYQFDEEMDEERNYAFVWAKHPIQEL